ncbi:MAG: hypothetical protein ACI9UU_003035 [Candidatus Azotimanducaceae bacterium]|jgi:hypothetical protein
MRLSFARASSPKTSATWLIIDTVIAIMRHAVTFTFQLSGLKLQTKDADPN